MKTRLYLSDGTSRDINVSDDASAYVWRERVTAVASWLHPPRVYERTARRIQITYPNDFIGPMMGAVFSYGPWIICTIFVQDYDEFKRRYVE